jgi:hypothetical protein
LANPYEKHFFVFGTRYVMKVVMVKSYHGDAVWQFMLLMGNMVVALLNASRCSVSQGDFVKTTK